MKSSAGARATAAGRALGGRVMTDMFAAAVPKADLRTESGSGARPSKSRTRPRSKPGVGINSINRIKMKGKADENGIRIETIDRNQERDQDPKRVSGGRSPRGVGRGAGGGGGTTPDARHKQNVSASGARPTKAPVAALGLEYDTRFYSIEIFHTLLYVKQMM
ncbi:hypothetical protein EVAR_60828_1 [Eumeta japonica]|uniref:Uncharacterized protein n=1 Tax=Eumeta variegata TaxID=151549 RepID=A0A4C1ZW99_EUMVA|nr:hypothetical protein EVAR_60828_1 [Eumeta japonica]